MNRVVVLTSEFSVDDLGCVLARCLAARGTEVFVAVAAPASSPADAWARAWLLAAGAKLRTLPAGRASKTHDGLVVTQLGEWIEDRADVVVATSGRSALLARRALDQRESTALLIGVMVAASGWNGAARAACDRWIAGAETDRERLVSRGVAAEEAWTLAPVIREPFRVTFLLADRGVRERRRADAIIDALRGLGLRADATLIAPPQRPKGRRKPAAEVAEAPVDGDVAVVVSGGKRGVALAGRALALGLPCVAPVDPGDVDPSSRAGLVSSGGKIEAAVAAALGSLYPTAVADVVGDEMAAALSAWRERAWSGSAEAEPAEMPALDPGLKIRRAEVPHQVLGALQLRSELAFLLSRLEVATAIGQLRSLSPLADAETDAAVGQLLRLGLVTVAAAEPSPAREAAASSAARPEISGPALVLLAAAIDSIDHFTLLGVESRVGQAEIDVALQRTAGVFNPEHAASEPERKALFAIYARVLEAGRVLRDPAARRDYERALAAAPRPRRALPAVD